jgi:RimJ/RimL family protein N-acetyltransferase
VLRPFRAPDFDSAMALSEDQNAPRDPSVPPLPATDPAGVVDLFEQYRADGELLHLVIADRVDDTYLGEVMVVIGEHRTGEFGCGLVEGARGRGIATEALRMFVVWSVTAIDIRRLQVLVAEENTTALRLAERVGFTPEGVLRSYWDQGGDRVDVVMLSMLPAEL